MLPELDSERPHHRPGGPSGPLGLGTWGWREGEGGRLLEPPPRLLHLHTNHTVPPVIPCLPQLL